MTLLPEGVSALAAIAIVFASLASSFITAAFGLGGGLFLLVAMGAAFPPASVVPVHGAAQLGANCSRFGFLFRDAQWPAIFYFLAGGALGAMLGARLYAAAPPWLLKMTIAGFVLAALFAPKPAGFRPGPRLYGVAGGVSSVLTMFVGATGPFVAGVLSTAPFNRMQIVSTHAAMMIAQHGLKSIAFGVLGFAFADWLFVILGILMAGFVGSWLGTRRLKQTPEVRFQRIFKMILAGLAVYLLTSGLLDAFAALKG